MDKRRRAMALFLFLVLCFGIELLGGLFTRYSVHGWYLTLYKAPWNPPPWLFGPVWTVLYGLIGISGWMIFCKAPSKQRTASLILYGTQLFFNLIWSFLFFVMKSPLLALIDITILFILNLVMLKWFWSLSKYAAWLILPYVLWIGYAVSLNAAIWLLN